MKLIFYISIFCWKNLSSFKTFYDVNITFKKINYLQRNKHEQLYTLDDLDAQSLSSEYELSLRTVSSSKLLPLKPMVHVSCAGPQPLNMD